MADPVYSVKVSEETKDQVQKMVDAAGCTSKEFFEKLLSAYEMELTKTGSPRYREEIREIEVLATRISQVVCNLVTMSDTELLIMQKKHQESEFALKGQIEELSEKNSSLLTTVKEVGKQLALAQEAKDEKEKQSKTAIEALAKSDELLNEYRSKNDVLNALIAENQPKIDGYNESVNQVINLSQKLEQQKKDHQREIDKMAEDLLRTQEEAIKDQAAIIEKMTTDLLHAQDKAQKDQVALLEKIDFLEKGFQKERESFEKERAGFEKERSGFEARIMDLKQSFEREIQLVKENAEAKIATRDPFIDK